MNKTARGTFLVYDCKWEVNMEEIDVSEFLSRGIALKTQMQDSIEWVPNVVLNLYPANKEIDLMFDERYKSMLVLVGDAVKLNYIDGNVQYFIETWITSIRVEPEKMMTLKVASVKKMNNLRKDERYSVNYAANIKSFETPSGIFGVVTNISLSGLGFIARQTFLIGEIVKISIFLPSKSFLIDAEVMRSNETVKGTEYGVSFVRTDDEALQEVYNLIQDIKEREDRLSHIVGFGMM
jgi:hypothetical protein